MVKSLKPASMHSNSDPAHLLVVLVTGCELLPLSVSQFPLMENGNKYNIPFT